ncbi:aldehyde dehydrogenase family 3 member B1-like isoform X2 [Falco biarmicus]|uniref:aldehyde dehydrogenase family 3 member B1-like isoform X2 n=1 Tax=Falco biarmicus TaxID=345155 RepID=UPI0024BC54CB|nr:aldehyde dehydrogenase family 3 member B1-like isoform X2 [Falco biarmicus]
MHQPLEPPGPQPLGYGKCSPVGSDAGKAAGCSAGSEASGGIGKGPVICSAICGNPYAGLVSHLRAAWLSGKTRPLEYRMAQLEALGRFLDEKKQDILDATALDMGKPSFEAYFTEILLCKNNLNDTLNNLSHWMKDEYVDKNLVTQLDSAFIHKDLYGVVLIIGPWNYPINLLLVPLIGAIAAGNCVVMKPSEISRNVERLVAETLPRYLDKDCFAVVTAGTEETTRLLENRFDYIFFTGTSLRNTQSQPSLRGRETGVELSRQAGCRSIGKYDHTGFMLLPPPSGSPSMGRIVMTAAAKHLTPVTLELGVKNPCYVSDTCNVQNVARRVAWGRFFNPGQTCVAPDYVLCSLEMQEKLLVALREAITEFYGPNPQESPDFARIVGDKHFQRVQALLRSGRVAIGGQTDAQTRYIAPTVLVDVQQDDPVMQEEIFGPILPILTVTSLDDAIAFINARERPLAIYVFSSCKKVVNQVLEKTSSGGFCANDTIMHMTLTSLPFGGIGQSGLGHYHGHYSFDTFAHPRAALLRGAGREALNTPRYPPYAPRRLPLLRATTETKRRAACTLL